jgi:transposase
VIARPTDSTKSVNFVSFHAELDSQVPAHLELHCIVDNLAAHGTPGVEEFLDSHHRVFLHRTPTHASWLNQVEMWFSILTRQLLDTAEFADTSDLAGAILDYVTDYNNHAPAFKVVDHDVVLTLEGGFDLAGAVDLVVVTEDHSNRHLQLVVLKPACARRAGER